MAGKNNTKQDFSIHVGGQDFDCGNAETHHRAQMALKLAHKTRADAAFSFIQGQGDPKARERSLEQVRRMADQKANEFMESPQGLAAFQDAYRMVERAEQQKAAEKDARIAAMEAANQRGIARGNLQVREKQTAEVEIER